MRVFRPRVPLTSDSDVTVQPSSPHSSQGGLFSSIERPSVDDPQVALGAALTDVPLVPMLRREGLSAEAAGLELGEALSTTGVQSLLQVLVADVGPKPAPESARPCRPIRSVRPLYGREPDLERLGGDQDEDPRVCFGGDLDDFAKAFGPSLGKHPQQTASVLLDAAVALVTPGSLARCAWKAWFAQEGSSARANNSANA